MATITEVNLGSSLLRRISDLLVGGGFHRFLLRQEPIGHGIVRGAIGATVGMGIRSTNRVTAAWGGNRRPPDSGL